jgi:hypothetical protein
VPVKDCWGVRHPSVLDQQQEQRREAFAPIDPAPVIGSEFDDSRTPLDGPDSKTAPRHVQPAVTQAASSGNFGAVLRTARAAAGLTLTDAAILVGVSRPR